MKSCIVIFPLYKCPSPLERAFLENGMRLTANFKQVIVAPEGLKVDETFGMLEKLEVKRFSRHYFEGIKGYNQLMLSKDFYRAFVQFDFLLIHQSDVFLFKDELQHWCNRDYDYIGAPWFRADKLKNNFLADVWQSLKLAFKKNKLYAQRHNTTGNGGLSLRKIATALKVLESANPSLLKKYSLADEPAHNEDIFWSLEAPRIMPAYCKPDLKEALQFAMEFQAEKAFHYIGDQLPFGCHAPLKHDFNFWKQHIPLLEHEK